MKKTKWEMSKRLALGMATLGLLLGSLPIANALADGDHAGGVVLPGAGDSNQQFVDFQALEAKFTKLKPNADKAVASQMLSGAEASEIYKGALKLIPAHRGSSLLTFFSTWKVYTSDDGLQRIFCESTTRSLPPPPKSSVTCTYAKSLNGKKLPRFIAPPIRMG